LADRLTLAVRLAGRELRTGVRGLRIVLACLALGVAAIAAVGSLRAAVDRGLAEDGRTILGGDLEVEGGGQPLPDSLRADLRAQGALVSDVVQTRSMLIAPSGERELVELKVVDAAWPLVGSVGLDPAIPVAAALGASDGQYGLVAEPVVMSRLGLRAGMRAQLGGATFVVRAALTSEPDRVTSPSLLGPRVLIAAAALPATGLIQPGSLVTYDLRAVLPPGVPVSRVIAGLRAAAAREGWRIHDAHDAAPGLQRFVDQLSLFLTLVGLTALLVGGIGVATGVRAWLEARARTIATLRCLGASGGLVFTVCLIQVLCLTSLGVLLGVVAGGALPLLAAGFLHDLLPIPAHLGVYPAPLALAGVYGMLTAGSFSLWPLGRAARIPGAALFRDALSPRRVGIGLVLVITNLALVVALVALVVATSPQRGFALWFCVSAAGALLLFQGGGAALVALAARLPQPRLAWVKLGLGNLHRPGGATPLMVVSLGLGLSTLATVALIQGNVRYEVLEQIPANAPSFYFIDIQNEQLTRFEAILHATPGVSDYAQVPSLRARMVAVNDVPVDQVRATPDTQWALRGDRGLTYAAAPPEGTKLVAGHWWPADYQGPPLVSFDANLARGWGVGVGDTLTVNVLGRDITLRIASLRDIAWRTLSLNFSLVASPGLLEHAPHMHIATVRVAPGDQGPLLRAVTDALPNVSGVLVADVLRALARFLGQIGAALSAVGTLTLASGALVLAGTVAAGQRRRMAEAVILKSLGATRGQIRGAWLVEFGVIGAVAGLIAAGVGTAASWAVMRLAMGADWAFLPGVLTATVLGCVALMMLFGYAGTEVALRARAAPMLRNE
jgi:putative ABC transport system permease protein